MQTLKGLEILISKKKIHEILISKIPKLHFLENQKSFCRKWKAFLLVSQVLSFRLINKLARCRRQPLTCLKIVSSIFMSLTGKKQLENMKNIFYLKSCLLSRYSFPFSPSLISLAGHCRFVSRLKFALSSIQLEFEHNV